MSSNRNAIVLEIKAIQIRLARTEAERVIYSLQIGQQLLKLKEDSPTNSKWLEYLRELGYHPRVADRYLQLGKSWWSNAEGGIQSTGLLDKIPGDLMILEYLCRLEPGELKNHLKHFNGKGGRSQIIEKLKELLEIQPKSKPVVAMTAEVAFGRLGRLKEDIVNVEHDARAELSTPAWREKLENDLLSMIADLSRRLTPRAPTPAVTIDQPMQTIGVEPDLRDRGTLSTASRTVDDAEPEESDDESEFGVEEEAEQQLSSVTA